MQIKKVMTKNPITLKPIDSLEKAIHTLADNKISGCPVVDSKKNVVGMITESDILRIIDIHSSIKSSSALLPLILGIIKSSEHFEDVKKSFQKVLDLEVKDFMVEDVISVDVEDDVYKAARLMNKHKINRLPVLDKNKLVGIISRADIIKALEKLE